MKLESIYLFLHRRLQEVGLYWTYQYFVSDASQLLWILWAKRNGTMFRICPYIAWTVIRRFMICREQIRCTAVVPPFQLYYKRMIVWSQYGLFKKNSYFQHGELMVTVKSWCVAVSRGLQHSTISLRLVPTITSVADFLKMCNKHLPEILLFGNSCRKMFYVATHVGSKC